MNNETNTDCNSRLMDDEELFDRMNRSRIEQSLPSSFLNAILKASKDKKNSSNTSELSVEDTK